MQVPRDMDDLADILYTSGTTGPVSYTHLDVYKRQDAHFVITADGGYRRGVASPLKLAVDEAVADCPKVEKVLVVRRTGQDLSLIHI